jgi:hypothetical protein
MQLLTNCLHAVVCTSYRRLARSSWCCVSLAVVMGVAQAQGAAEAQSSTADPIPELTQLNPLDLGDPIDEIVVKGQRLTRLRSAVTQARIDFFDALNDALGEPEFRVRCDRTASTGTRIPQVNCRARFVDDAQSYAWRTMLSTGIWVDPTNEIRAKDKVFRLKVVEAAKDHPELVDAALRIEEAVEVFQVARDKKFGK